MNSVTIIGAGAVARSIALALFYGGVKIDGIYSLHGNSAELLARKVKARVFGRITDISSVAGVTVLCVPDGSISSTAGLIAKQCTNLKHKVIIHTSGALSSNELGILKKRGASVGSFHPMQTFPKNRNTQLKDVWIAIEGERRALHAGRELAKILGAHTFAISKEAKVLYHTAGVFAANYLVTLLSAVEQIAKEIDIPRKNLWNIYTPIIEQTLSNVIATSPEEALTGPIARGDLGTVTKHVRALSTKKLNHLVPLYAALGVETARVARKRNKK